MNLTITDRSKSLGEPEAIVRFRERMEREGTQTGAEGVLNYGIKIGTSLVDVRGDYPELPAYTVRDASKQVEIYTWKEAMLDEDTSGIAAQALLRAGELLGVPPIFSSLLARYRDGILIYVQPELGPLGEIVEAKMGLETIAAASTADVIVVYAKTASRVVVHDRMSAAHGVEFGRTFIVIAEDDASVSIVCDRRGASGATLIERRVVFAGEHARVDLREAIGDAVLGKIDTEILLQGEGASAGLRSVAILGGSSRVDLQHIVRHAASETRSRVRTAGLVGGAGCLIHRGLIDMEHGVRDVEGEEDGRYFTNGEHAEVDAIPSLDIATNDVKSSHRLAIVHLSEKELFYPETRGIAPEDARSLLVGGALRSAFDDADRAYAELDDWITAASETLMSSHD